MFHCFSLLSMTALKEGGVIALLRSLLDAVFSGNAGERDQDTSS